MKINATNILIIGGDCRNNDLADRVSDWLIEGLRNFEGVIIGGGTTAGVSGLVGKIGEQYREKIYTIGYAPASIKSDDLLDARYSEHRFSKGDFFSIEEADLYWSEIEESEIPFDQVRLLGLGGGIISSTEYRLALENGAKVGLVKNSGRAMEQFWNVPVWDRHEALTWLDEQSDSLAAFLE